MDAEQAKLLFEEAQAKYEAGTIDACVDILNDLNRAFPGSRRVLYLRALCSAASGEMAEAEALARQLEGRLAPDTLGELRKKLEEAHARANRPTQVIHGERDAAAPDDAPPRPAEADAEDEPNAFIVDAAYSVGGDITCVSGRMESGVFYIGDSVSVITPDGLPISAPIVRIGAKDTPLRVLRAGQSASIFLRVDPQQVTVGSRITSTSSPEAFAATVLAAPGQGSADMGEDDSPDVRTGGGPASEDQQRARVIERALNSHQYDKAQPDLEVFVQEQPDSADAHRLMARFYLEAGAGARDPGKALEHAKRAFELDGTGKPAVLSVLADALGASGEPERGLRYLENLFSQADGHAEQSAMENRIADYRARHGLGTVYEFRNEFNDIVFESGSIDEIVKAFNNGAIPRNATCRRNRVGEFRAVESTLALEHPQLRSLYVETRTTPYLVLLSAAGGAILFAVLGALAFPQAGIVAPILGALVAAAVGGCVMALRKR